MARPLRADVPIYLAAMGPKAVALAQEIGDGWLPLFFVPERAREVFGDLGRDGFDVAPSVPVVLLDDVEAARDALKPYYALYIGGMGSRGKNSCNELFARYGYEDEAKAIQDAYLDGRQRDAAALVPDAFVDEGRARGPEGADRGAARGVSRLRRDDAAPLDAAARGAARRRRARALTARRRLYLMRHAEVAYFDEARRPGEPETVVLTEEGRAQAEAARDALDGAELDLVIASGLERTAETARIVAGREPERWPELNEWEGGRLHDVPEEELEDVFTRALEVTSDDERFLGGESLGGGPCPRRAGARPPRGPRLGHVPRRPARRDQPGAPLVRPLCPAARRTSAGSSRRPAASTSSTSARKAGS